MVKAKAENVFETAEFKQTLARFNELKSMFKEVGSQRMQDKPAAESGIFKQAMAYKSRKQEMTPEQAAQVLKKAKRIAIFTGDVINSGSENQMRFEEEKDSTTQLFVKKNFLMYPKKIWNWVKDYKGKVDEMDQNSIVNDVIDFLQYVEGNNYGKLRNQRVQTAVITSCIDGIQKRKIQEAGLNTEVFEIDGSIDRANCGTTHSDVVCNSEQVFDFNSLSSI